MNIEDPNKFLKPEIPQQSESSGENFCELNKWYAVEGISPVSWGISLENSFRQKLISENQNTAREYDVPIPQRARGSISRAIKSALGELKTPIENIQSFNYRFVEVPESFFESHPSVKYAIAYEIEVRLETKYKLRGGKGFYTFLFIINASEMTEKGKNNSPHKVKRIGENALLVRTTVDPQSRQQAKAEAEDNRARAVAFSQVNFIGAIQRSIQNPIQGGLPGLGKKR